MVPQMAYGGWHRVHGLEELLTEERGGGRQWREGSSAMGDRGHAAVSLTPGTDEMHACVFESLQLEDLYVGDLLYSLRTFFITSYLSSSFSTFSYL